jgi:hypothetical protein
MEEYNVIIKIILLHSSDVSRNKLGELKLLTNSPSFNYIGYCRYLNLDKIQRIINENIFKKD